jgi:large subunit ribosomal protein L32
MPNPKWRHSKRRKRARRTHYKAEAPQISTCKITGEKHLYHRAYFIDGSMFYKGQVVVQGAVPEVAE